MNALGILKSRVCIITALALSLSGLAQAQAMACFTGNFYGRDIMISFAVVTMLFVVSIAYMFSKFMSQPTWEAWAKTEAYQALISCVLAASMIFIANISCVLATDLSGGNPFAITNEFLAYQYDQTLGVIIDIYQTKFVLDYLSSYNLVAATNPLIIVPRFPGIASISQNLNTAITIFSVLAGNIMVQRLVFQIIEQIAFTLILPLGLVLRVIPITRDAGSFLIAVAFGFYIIFPLTYVMSKEVLDALEDRHEDPPQILGTFTGFLPGPRTFMLISIVFNPLTYFFDKIKDMNFVLVATFFPALNITITLTFVKALTKAIIHNTG